MITPTNSDGEDDEDVKLRNEIDEKAELRKLLDGISVPLTMAEKGVTSLTVSLSRAWKYASNSFQANFYLSDLITG